MKRIESSSSSEALINALEHADEMEDVLVLYYTKPEATGGSYFCSSGMKASDALWLLEQFKLYLLGVAKREPKED